MGKECIMYIHAIYIRGGNGLHRSRRIILINSVLSSQPFIKLVRKLILIRQINKRFELFTTSLIHLMNISCQIMIAVTRLDPNNPLKKENDNLVHLKHARHIRIDLFNKSPT